MDADALTALSLLEAADEVRARRVSPVELTRACLDRIERLNPRLNAFITVTADAALEAAANAEREIGDGDWRGPLHGIPIALKDLYDTAGVLTTAGSGLYAERVPDADAEVVRRLSDAGAISLGKLNMHEFAYGGTSHISHFGPPRNPWDTERIAGGSSGGSAAAVAAGLCFGALGSDTGGSIRQPAAMCGIVGLKPTYGRVSIRGVIPLSWSLDHAGPMTRTVADATAMLQVLAGYDAEDATTVDLPVPDYSSALERDAGSLRVGIPRVHFYEDLDGELEACLDAALGVMSELAATTVDVDLPDIATLRQISGPVLQAEAYAYHANDVAERPGLYDPDTLGRIQRGGEVSTRDYIFARRELDRVRREVQPVFEQVDVLITPTTPVPAPTLEESAGDIGLMTLRNTSPFNAYGLPTVSIPAGFTASGLPVGLQVTGKPFDEGTVLRVARAFERATEWGSRRPPV